VLVGGQVALSLMLLTVSAFLYRSFQSELDRGPGFRTENILMVTFEPGLARYDEARSRGFYRLLKEGAQATAGVTTVSLTSAVPMRAGEIGGTLVAPEGFQFPAGAENVSVMTADVDEHYFDALAIPMVMGRSFRATDTSDAPRVAVVNETFASRYWPGQSAIGKRVRLDNAGRTFAEVVGVAKDSKYFFIIEAPVEFLYLAHMQGSARRSTLLVATNGPAAGMAAPLRELVRSIDANMPLLSVRTLEDFYASRIVFTTRLLVGSVGGMGTMGLMLALVGLYGLVAYNASRRTHEIGIRMALGAKPGAVLRMVLRHGLQLAAGGLLAGLVASVAANNALRAAFANSPVADFGAVPGRELPIYAQTVFALVVVVLLAMYFPARRAARIDPLSALRQE
jgi:predicted permease